MTENLAHSPHKSPESCTNSLTADRNISGPLGSAYVAALIVASGIRQAMQDANNNDVKMPASNAEFQKMSDGWTGELTLRGFDEPFGKVVIGPKPGQFTAQFTRGLFKGKQLAYLFTAKRDQIGMIEVCRASDNARTTVPDIYLKDRENTYPSC